MALTSMMTGILSALTVFGQVALVLGLIAVIFELKKKKNKQVVHNCFAKNSLWLGFIVALVAMLGSLFYSNIAGYTPCTLCWFQRIMMYPLVILFGIAAIKKDYTVRRYALPMAIIGALIAAYQYSTQIMLKAAPCSATGPSCAARYAWTLGYITIPMMALTAFALIITLMIVAKKR
jgi:disulfide bond formation protein DsbB